MLVEHVSFLDLTQILQRTPVMGDVHPMVPLCLNKDIEIKHCTHHFIDSIDDFLQTINTPILLLGDDNPVLRQRFRSVCSLDHPPVEIINQNIKSHLDYIRENMLTTHKIADHIETDTSHRQSELVVLLLIDGLSYADVLNWPAETQPCFVDGPSVTFQTTENSSALVPSVGFAGIIGNPPISERLYHLGYRNAFGYTYWEARNNILAQYMFRGIPDNAVVNFETILKFIEEENIPSRSYVQIVREGLDGLAHGKRELRATEIGSAIQAIKNDIERLVTIIQQKNMDAVIYITADHGILWKNEHDWEILNHPNSKPRYSKKHPDNSLSEYVVRLENNGIPFYLFTYPYLGTTIRKNDSGTHGGLSYQESFVPFIKIEV